MRTWARRFQLSSPLSRGRLRRVNAISESIIEADPEQARLEAVAGAGEPIGPVGQVDIEILDPRRPGAGQRNLHPGAGRPTGVEPRLAQAPKLDLALAEGEPERAVHKHIAERIAEPAAHCAEPWVRELPGRETVLRARKIEL